MRFTRIQSTKPVDRAKLFSRQPTAEPNRNAQDELLVKFLDSVVEKKIVFIRAGSWFNLVGA